MWQGTPHKHSTTSLLSHKHWSSCPTPATSTGTSLPNSSPFCHSFLSWEPHPCSLLIVNYSSRGYPHVSYLQYSLRPFPPTACSETNPVPALLRSTILLIYSSHPISYHWWLWKERIVLYPAQLSLQQALTNKWSFVFRKSSLALELTGQSITSHSN